VELTAQAAPAVAAMVGHQLRQQQAYLVVAAVAAMLVAQRV
jgi:hypothetical protein